MGLLTNHMYTVLIVNCFTFILRNPNFKDVNTSPKVKLQNDVGIRFLCLKGRSNLKLRNRKQKQKICLGPQKVQEYMLRNPKSRFYHYSQQM